MKRCFIIIIALSIIACKHSATNRYSGLEVIDFAKSSMESDAELFETTFIKLETTDNSLIGGYIAQIEAANEHLFILTGGGNINLLVFDLSGKFKGTIGKIGRGPGEYIVPISFSIHFTNNVISVVDIAQKKIIDYSLDDYKFLADKNMEVDSFCFEYLGNDKIVWKNANYQDSLSDWSFIVTDTEQQFLNKFVKKDFKTGYSTGPAKNLYKLEEHVFAYAQYNPILYKFMGDKVVPAYHIKFGEHQLPPLDYLQKISADNNNFISTLNESNYISYYCIFDTNRTLCIFYSVTQNTYIGFYDKDNKQVYRFLKNEFQDKLRIGEMERPVGIIDDYVVTLIDPFYLLEKNAQGYLFDNRLYPFISEMQEDDNPILFLFKIKGMEP